MEKEIDISKGAYFGRLYVGLIDESNCIEINIGHTITYITVHEAKQMIAFIQKQIDGK